MNLHELDLEDNPVKRIKKTLDPKNYYEWCQAFSKITGMPVGYFLKYCKGFEPRHFEEIRSWAKANKSQKMEILTWFKKYRESIKPLPPTL